MDRIPSDSSLSTHSSVGPLDEQELNPNIHSSHSSASVGGRGAILTSSWSEQIRAHFNDQQSGQSSSSANYQIRDEYHNALLGSSSRTVHQESSVLNSLQQVEQRIVNIRNRLNVQGSAAQRSTGQEPIHEIAEALYQNHKELIRLFNSHELSNLNTSALEGLLKNDSSNLRNIVSNNNLQEEEETKEEGELKEFKEEDEPISFDVALEQIEAALNHADEVIRFLRENFQLVQHQQQQEGNCEEVGDHGSDVSSYSSILESASNDSEMLGNNQDFQEFYDHVAQVAENLVNRHEVWQRSARNAEARGNLSNAHIYWQLAERTARDGQNTTEQHQQENNNNYRYRSLADELEARHELWTQAQQQAREGVQRVQANISSCVTM